MHKFHGLGFGVLGVSMEREVCFTFITAFIFKVKSKQ